MDSHEFIYKLFNNIFFGIFCLITGFLRLRRLLKRGIEVPKNRIIQSDLDALLVNILLIIFGLVSIFIKILK
jgi:hypothetical protein